MATLNKDRIKYWLTIVSSIVVPGSGYVYIGLPARGLIMLMWMFAFAFITYQLTSPDMAFIWRISGGLLVWVISILDVWKRARQHWNGK